MNTSASRLSPTNSLIAAYNKPISGKRIRLVQATGQADCGPACLKMIFDHYRVHTSIDKITQQSDTGRDGLTAASILKTAQAYGFTAKAYSAEVSSLGTIHLPAILHWQGRHFVVLEKIDRHGFHILDPQSGKCKLNLDEFCQAFSGIVIIFSYEKDRIREPKTKSNWSGLIGNLLKIKFSQSLLWQIVMVSLLIQGLGLAGPVATKLIIDRVIPLGLKDTMNLLLAGTLLTALAYGMGQYLRSSILIVLQERLNTRMIIGFCKHLFSLPLSFFQRRTTGDLLLRLSSNNIIKELLSSQFSSIFLDSLFVLAYFSAIIFLDWQYGIIAGSFAGLQIILIVLTARPIHRYTQQELLTQSAYQGQLVELLQGIESVKLTGREQAILDQWMDLYFKNLSVAIRSSYLTAIVDVLMRTLSVLAPLSLLWFGANRVLDEQITLGTMFALQALALSALAPLSTLVANAQRLQMVGAHLERICGVFDADPEQDRSKSDKHKKVAPDCDIRIKQLCFRFPGAAENTLEDIQLHICAGERIAIVGPSGSGKSTLVRLLVGLLPPTSGKIEYAGTALSQIDLQYLRSHSGLVPQSPHLFSGSISDNIAFGHLNLDQKTIIKAAKSAAIHDDICQMPLGYDTPLAEAGSGLSGGQKQRIALARAFAGSPRLLMLDEASSHLDSATENTVFSEISKMSCTRIIVAHRLSTISNADRILVLERGRLVQQGKHSDLITQSGMYRKLIESQT